MPPVFVNTIVFVTDIELSKKFYSEILNIQIKKDLGNIVFFENNLVLHCASSLLETVFKGDAPQAVDGQGKNNLLIYFECASHEALQDAYQSLKGKVIFIHHIEPQTWGQNVFRFYDPDGHIIEFGESITENDEP